jgi:hypothetical protein
LGGRSDYYYCGRFHQRAKEESEIRKITFKIKKNRRHSWIGHTVRHNEFVVDIPEEAISGGKKAVGRPRLQYLKQVACNTAADSYTAMERMACNNNCRWKAANQSKE